MKRQFKLTPLLVLLLITLITPTCFAGLFGGDDIIIIKKDLNDANVALNYVPYIGATNSVNLNDKNLTNITRLGVNVDAVSGSYDFEVKNPAGTGGSMLIGGGNGGKLYFVSGNHYIDLSSGYFNIVTSQTNKIRIGSSSTNYVIDINHFSGDTNIRGDTNIHRNLYVDGNIKSDCIKLRGDSGYTCAMPSGSGGNPFDQDLNTTSDVNFLSILLKNSPAEEDFLELKNFGIFWNADNLSDGMEEIGLGIDTEDNFEFLGNNNADFVFRDANVNIEDKHCLFFNKAINPASICIDDASVNIDTPVGGTLDVDGDYMDLTGTSVALLNIDGSPIVSGDLNVSSNLGVVGEVRANKYYGDGSLLTGISTLDTNAYTAGILKSDNNSVRIDWNMGNNDIINAKDVNITTLNVFDGVNADKNRLIYTVKDSNISTSLLMTNTGHLTDWGGLSMRVDPSYAPGQGLYLLGNARDGGRIYFACLNSSLGLTNCYSMNFTNITNWEQVPQRIIQKTITTDTYYCSSGRGCSVVGNASGDIAFPIGAGSYLYTWGNQTNGQPGVKWKSFLSTSSGYNNQAYYSAFSYDTNATTTYLNGLLHTKWLTAGVTKMTLTPEGDLNVVGDLNINENFYGNQIYGEDYNKADAGFETVNLVNPDEYVRVTRLNAGSLNGFTVADGNLVAVYGGVYQVNGSLSIGASGLSEYGIKGFVNDTGQDNCYAHGHLSASQVDNLNFTCFVRLTVGQNFNVRIDDHSNPVNDPTLYSMNVNLLRVGN